MKNLLVILMAMGLSPLALAQESGTAPTIDTTTTVTEEVSQTGEALKQGTTEAVSEDAKAMEGLTQEQKTRLRKKMQAKKHEMHKKHQLERKRMHKKQQMERQQMQRKMNARRQEMKKAMQEKNQEITNETNTVMGTDVDSPPDTTTPETTTPAK